MESLGTILGVWAHPDDETYLSAGLMARGARAGDRVVCVTATRGEEGSQDPVRWPPETLGEVREAELMRSLDIVGVREHHWLDYRDGTCAGVDAAEAIARVTAILEEVAPDSVLTFGPDGMTGHDDHKTVSAWTTEAFRRAAKPGARLYYATQTQAWADRWLPRLEPFNVFGPGSPPITPVEDLAIDFTLPDDLLEVKIKAIEAHTSQAEGLIAAFGPDEWRDAQRTEFFRLAEVRQ